MANWVHFQWNQFWCYLHAGTLAHKREATQKADLHFAMQCKFLVSKYFNIFKSKWCWLRLLVCKPKASMISIFYCTAASLVYVFFFFLAFGPFHTSSAVYPTVTHIQQTCSPGGFGRVYLSWLKGLQIETDTMLLQGIISLPQHPPT